jgi:hypothetical protein
VTSWCSRPGKCVPVISTSLLESSRIVTLATVQKYRSAIIDSPKLHSISIFWAAEYKTAKERQRKLTKIVRKRSLWENLRYTKSSKLSWLFVLTAKVKLKLSSYFTAHLNLIFRHSIEIKFFLINSSYLIIPLIPTCCWHLKLCLLSKFASHNKSKLS